MNLKALIIAFLLLQSHQGFCQDIHFSQFNMSPLSLNPALSGLFDGDYRFAANYRGQWASVPVPYTTFSGSFDMNLSGNRLEKDKVGGGVFIYTDKAGDADFGTTQLSTSLAYIKTLRNDLVYHAVSIGIQPGLVQRSINFPKLRFDNQYNGDTFDPAASTGETFPYNNFSYFNLSAGINWVYKPKERFSYNLGAGLFNINAPEQSFFSNTDIRLFRKFILHGGTQFRLSSKLDLMPAFMFLKQYKYTEVSMGTSLKFLLEKRRGQDQAFYAGTWLRYADAIILSTGYDYQNFQFGLSYDINISNLRPASNGRGGLEIAVIYILKKVPPVINKKICPTYL